jgi:hypothetical protein
MPYKDKEKQRAYFKRRYQRNREKCNAATRKSYQKHKEERRAKARQQRLEIKQEVLTHYGNGRLACVRCGFNDIRALSVDHIKGGGKQAERVRGATSIYSWLKRRGLSTGLQTLCMNCQFIKKLENKEQISET